MPAVALGISSSTAHACAGAGVGRVPGAARPAAARAQAGARRVPTRAGAAPHLILFRAAAAPATGPAPSPSRFQARPSANPHALPQPTRHPGGPLPRAPHRLGPRPLPGSFLPPLHPTSPLPSLPASPQAAAAFIVFATPPEIQAQPAAAAAAHADAARQGVPHPVTPTSHEGAPARPCREHGPARRTLSLLSR
jgi:hypothetical protein